MRAEPGCASGRSDGACLTGDARRQPSARTEVAAWTSSRRRPSTSGSVRGQHAVAEVEDVARPAAGAARARRAPPPRRAPTGRAARAGSRFPWTPRSSPTSAQPSSSGMRQSRPITSPPAAAIAGSSVAVPVPKWIVGTSTRSGEDPRRPRRDELVVVGRRERADPRVEELHDVGAGPRLRRDVRRRSSRASFSSSARQTVGLAVHQRLRRPRTRATACPRRGSRRR